MNTEQLILLYLLGAAVYLLLGIFVMRITTTPPPKCIIVLQKHQTAIPLTLMTVLTVAIIAVACFLPFQHTDVGVYNNWGNWILENGPDNFYLYNENAHPPVYLLLCAAFSALSKSTGIGYAVFYRVTFTIVFLISVVVLYRICLRFLDRIPSMMVTALYAICPAMLMDCGFWGQTDAFTCLFALLIFSGLQQKKYFLSYLWVFLALCFKLQIVFLLPCLILWVVYSMIKEHKTVRCILYTIALIVAIWAQFLITCWTQVTSGDVFAFLDVFLGVANNKSFFTSFALNIWGIFGLQLKIASSAWRYVSYALILLLSVTLFIGLIKSKYKHKLLIACILQQGIFYFFCIAMLERYFLPAAPMMLLLIFLEKDKKLQLSGLIVTALHFVALGCAWLCRYTIPSTVYIMFLSIANVAAMAVFTNCCIRLLFPSYTWSNIKALFKKRFGRKEKDNQTEQTEPADSETAPLSETTSNLPQ